MATQISTQQSTAQAGRQLELRTPQSVPETGNTAVGVSATEEKSGVSVGASTAQVAGAGVLIAAAALVVAVFGAGFMRTRVERGVARLFDRFVDVARAIDVPLLLPLTIAEMIREVLADRRSMAPLSGR